MRDIRLWQLLQRPKPPADVLVPLLRELAELPLDERFPFFGLLPRAIRHDDADVRAAAVSALHGAAGILAFRHLVRALHDPEPVVRFAAVGALRNSAGHDLPRWAHALFHPDAAVRQAALAPDRFPLTHWYVLHLLPDPECAELVRPALGGINVPGSALPLLFDHLRTGLLDRATVCDLVARIPWKDCFDALSRAQLRVPDDVTRVLALLSGLKEGDGADAETPPDALDELFELFWDTSSADGTEPAAIAFYDKLATGVFGMAPPAQQRVVCALLVTARRRGRWDRRAAQLAAVLHPGLLFWAWIPRDVRREAIRGFYVRGNRCPKAKDEVVRALVLHNVCRRASGAIDLWAIGGLLHMVEANPYRKLHDWVGANAIVAAFLEDMEDSAPFFCHQDDSDKGRLFLIHAIGEQRRPARPRLFALLVHAVSADNFDFLAPLSFTDALDVLGELFRMGKPLSGNKEQRVAELLGPRIANGPLDVFLCVWLNQPAAEEIPLGLRMLGVLARAVDISVLLKAVRGLDAPALVKFLAAVPASAGFPYAKEVLLAAALEKHPLPEARAWSAARLVQQTPPAPQPALPPAGTVAKLTKTDADKIARCSETALGRTVGVAMPGPATGLCAALARRTAPTRPSVEVCVALLACHDPLEQVAEQFARFGGDTASFLMQLDKAAVTAWRTTARLSLFGHAWLHRWEQHVDAFAAGVERAWPHGIADALAHTPCLTARGLGRVIWEATALLLGTWRWRQRPRLAATCTPRLGEVLVAALTTEFGTHAASILVQLHEANVAPERVSEWKEAVARRLPDLGAEVRRVLRFWLDARGLPAQSVPPRPAAAMLAADLAERIRACADLDTLAEWCRSDNLRVVEEAALRLLELGSAGLDVLARRIVAGPSSAVTVTLANTVSLWPEGDALRAVAAFVGISTSPAELRFVAGTNLLQRGDTTVIEHVLDAVCQEMEAPWFRPEDWQRLVDLGQSPWRLALRLAASPQPHAYMAAVELLTDQPDVDAEAVQALHAFLDCGTDRLTATRRRAARWLRQRDDWTGLPLLLIATAGKGDVPVDLLGNATVELVEAVTAAVLTAGTGVVAEKTLFQLLDHAGVDPEARTRGFARLLTDGTVLAVKNSVVQKWKHSRARDAKLRRLAEAFAWGIQRGRELTGKLFNVKMLGSRKLGYTRFTQNNVYVSPLPILQGEMHGPDTVRGLIVHELGHHMYHAGKGPEAIWKAAQDEGMHELLNLVADEHLERNLRAHDGEFGDQLKRLAAYAFQHLEREVSLDGLLDGLQGRAFAVLTATRLGVARKKGHVVVESGKILQEMERAGLSFARFCRALRMGLGNRYNDPRVARGLELFKGKFRQSSMEELWERTRQLKEIFGWETQILRCLGQDEGLHPDDADVLDSSDGITEEELQGEVERVLEPRQRRESERDSKGVGAGRPWLNFKPDERFNVITNVVPVPFDPVQHAELAGRVARPARQMRRFLEELGLRLEPQRLRLQGKTFDKTRIQAVVTRNDPRMLVARKTESKTDLFLGVIVDCSGSMAAGANIEKAKLFAAMLAEAARDLRGIDLRMFGFTDRAIFDAGTAQRCAAHGLKATDGNNDAAGLWHAAQVARNSRRKAKVLVMISDGLPTECTVAALRALVQKLTRLKMCCAQVAVRPLAEVCFPHYVLLEEADQEASVRRFGTIIARLVQKTLRGG